MADTKDNQGSTSNKPKEQGPYMREERFDTESPQRLLDSRPVSKPLVEQPAPDTKKLLQS